MAKQAKQKFPLLVYQRWGSMLSAPSLLIAIASGIVWWFAPHSPMLADKDWLLILITLVALAVFIYSLLARRAAYVQCFSKYIKIRTPFLTVAISYKRLAQVQPIKLYSELHRPNMNDSQLRLLKPFMGRTGILLKLRGYPMDEGRLRRWLPRHMFSIKVKGFVLVIEDWMGLSRQIGHQQELWLEAQRERNRKQSGSGWLYE